MQTSLVVNDLSFTRRSKHLLKQFNFEFVSKQKIALIGLNGAGKSTFLKLLVGELAASSGEINIPQLELNSIEFKAKLGYQADSMHALSELTATEYLALCYQAKLGSISNFNAALKQLSEDWHLESILPLNMASLSQGNLQKLSIVQAFLHRPAYLYLDEPTQNLDPVEQNRFIQNLQSYDQHQLIIFSSHHVNEMIAIADTALVMHQGQLIAPVELNAGQQFWFISSFEKNTFESASIGQGLKCCFHFSKTQNFLYSVTLNNHKEEDLVQIITELDQDVCYLQAGEFAVRSILESLASGRTA